MDADRLDILRDLFHQALELPPEWRSAFLDDTCRSHPDLCDELRSLVAHDEGAADFFDSLEASLFAASEDALDRMLHHRQGSISHYQVLERLGGGGMGVVYKARDTRLDRHVALKFLSPDMSRNVEAKQRFVQEAKSASALDHPNIATIHEISETKPSPEEPEARLFIAMAYYQGETLKKKIERGPLPVHEALDYTIQVARGLAKAHAHKIIHRDIKPANIIVTEPAPGEAEGTAKILDFGLAKMADVQLTQTGARMGTVAYMSPEQAKGDPVDHRTDIWALGVVLYEMLTGERPFKGDYPEAVIYSVLHETPPPITEIDPDLPADLERVVATCLAKTREQRYATITDLLADLEAWRKKVTPPSPLRTVVIAGVSVLVTILVLVAVQTFIQARPSERYLAVMPVVSVDADSSDQVFTAGLSETLTRRLKLFESSEETFWVQPSDEIDYNHNTLRDPIEVWKKFGTNLIIQVNAKRDADTIRVTIDLLEIPTQESQRMEIVLSVDKQTTLEYEMVSQIAAKLGIDLTPPIRRMLTAGSTTKPKANRFYTDGLGALHEGSTAVNRGGGDLTKTGPCRHSVLRPINQSKQHGPDEDKLSQSRLPDARTDRPGQHRPPQQERKTLAVPQVRTYLRCYDRHDLLSPQV